MTHRQRAVASVTMPCLFGWFAEALLIFMAAQTVLSSTFNPWTPEGIFTMVTILGFAPCCGFMMGLVHGLFLPECKVPFAERQRLTRSSLWIFHCVPLLLSQGLATLIVFSASPGVADAIGILCFLWFFSFLILGLPAVILGLFFGLGRKWSEKLSIPIFLGVTNEWERNE